MDHEPARSKKLPPRPTRLDTYKPLIDAMLRADLDAHRKQHHTCQRIFDRLLDEHEATDLSYGIVRRYVAERRPQIRIEAGRGPVEAFITQTHLPGAEKAVHRVFLSCGQEAFFEGHAHAFDVLGGVPFGKIRYDNLKAAVARILGFARQRVETERWTAFRSHYGIESFYCRPGIKGAHEKGGVEGQIGWFRRNHFVPVPEVASLAELNQMVELWDEEDEARRIRSRTRTIGEHFAIERPLLSPLPDEPFETGRCFSLRVDRHSQISVRTNRYSVPVRLIGRPVRESRPSRMPLLSTGLACFIPIWCISATTASASTSPVIRAHRIRSVRAWPNWARTVDRPARSVGHGFCSIMRSLLGGLVDW
ncbi:hypothetical protein ACFWTE_04920 [Nocardiopsis sp. NPDC058631]|uniref:Mu transposase domain-containing protein n=1 Tax=Nocardiopsis sp. NPDC058631 TaxID=3346566 RepID=UPI00366A415D